MDGNEDRFKRVLENCCLEQWTGLKGSIGYNKGKDAV